MELSLHPGQAILEQKTTLYNPSRARHRFYWWTNAGIQDWDDSRLYYPQEFSVFHGFTDQDTWPVDHTGVDLSVVGNRKYGPVSRFSFGNNEPWMAVYHAKTNAGVVHYATRTDLPSKKAFSWGSDAEGLRWREALSDNHSAYCMSKFRQGSSGIRRHTAFWTRNRPYTLRNSGFPSARLAESCERIQRPC